MIRQLYLKHFKCSMNDLPETPRTSDQYLVRWHSLTDLQFLVISKFGPILTVLPFLPILGVEMLLMEVHGSANYSIL